MSRLAFLVDTLRAHSIVPMSTRSSRPLQVAGTRQDIVLSVERPIFDVV